MPRSTPSTREAELSTRFLHRMFRSVLMAVVLATTLVVVTTDPAGAIPAPTASLAVTSQPFVGEATAIVVTFDNTSATTSDIGYGPYVDLSLPATGIDGAGSAVDDGLTFTSATYLGTAVTSTTLTYNGSCQAVHPLTALVVTCPAGFRAGDQLVVLTLPFGSFSQNQPAVNIDVTLALSNQADVGAALTVAARAGSASVPTRSTTRGPTPGWSRPRRRRPR